MKKDLRDFIKRIKEIRLSDEERSLLRSNISEFISFNPIRGKISFPRNKIYLSIFEVRHFAKATALVLIFGIVVAGSGVSYAASSALPGDKLYSIKVNVNEEVEDHLALTPEAKMVVQSKKVERRLEEAQILVKEKRLSPENKKIVEDKIDEHITELSKQIETLKEDGDVEPVLETTANLTPVLEAHKEILEEKNTDNKSSNGGQDTSTLIAKVEDSIQKVEAEEDGVIADAVEVGTPTAVETTAVTMSAKEITPAPSVPQEDQAAEKTATEIKDISDKIQNIVETRIRTAKEKIKIIKDEQAAEEKASQEALQVEPAVNVETSDTLEEKPVDTPITTDTILSTKLNVAIPTTKDSSDTTVAEVKPDIALTPVNTPPQSDKKIAPVVPADSFDVDDKIHQAEELLRKAESLANNGHYKEALSIAQEVNKIASEIETHKKLKALEVAKNAQQNSTTMQAEASSAIKTK